VTFEFENTACGYEGKAVLRGFSAVVARGDILCLLGPNGIGKTTLLKTALGLLPPLAGRITVGGQDTAAFSPRDLARRVGCVPQFHAPPFAFRVLDMVVMGRAPRLGTFARPARSDYVFAEKILAQLGISRLKDRVFTQLSGGERQMALIARALAQEVDFLLLDEVTTNLDFGNQARILEQIQALAGEGLGVIMTTHYPEHVLLLGEKPRAALLRPDGTVLTGPAREVLTGENLSAAYGVRVAVTEVSFEGAALPVCQPLLASPH